MYPTAPKHEQLYAANLRIIYVVDGQPITVDLTSFKSSNYEETVRRAAEFPAGSRHDIRYDPSKPNQARIGAGWNRRFFAVPLITLGCGLAFAALALGFFISSKLGKSGPPPKLAEGRPDDHARQQDGDDVFRNRDEGVLHVQLRHQHAPDVVAGERSDQRADDAEHRSRNWGGRARGIQTCAAQSTHDHSGDQRHSGGPRRSLGELVA